MMIEAEHPLMFRFHAEAEVNGKKLQRKHGCGISYIPEKCICQQEKEQKAEKLIEHYGLNPELGWKIHRTSYEWGEISTKEIEHLKLHLVSDRVEFPGIHIFHPKAGDTVSFEHPVTGAVHTHPCILNQ